MQDNKAMRHYKRKHDKTKQERKGMFYIGILRKSFTLHYKTKKIGW